MLNIESASPHHYYYAKNYIEILRNMLGVKDLIKQVISSTKTCVFNFYEFIMLAFTYNNMIIQKQKK